MSPVGERGGPVASRSVASRTTYYVVIGIVALACFGATSVAVRPIGGCIEGGIYLGFPFAFWMRCYGPTGPAGEDLGEPLTSPLAAAFDVAVWFGIVWAVGHVVVRAAPRRGRA